MIEVLSVSLAVALLAALGLQGLMAMMFALVVQRRLASSPVLAQPPAAAEVVLCLRGADPSLAPALCALASQTYPGPWRLLVVVDSREDQAWSVAEEQISRLETRGTPLIGNLADIKMPPRRRLRKNTLYQLLTSFPEPYHFYE